jgi:hypothetical protein
MAVAAVPVRPFDYCKFIYIYIIDDPLRQRRKIRLRTPLSLSRRILMIRNSRIASTHCGLIWTARVNIFVAAPTRPIALYSRPSKR